MTENYNTDNKKVIVICGPTASSKTALAVECAKLLDSEIISADSMYIYKKMNIGTAKPTTEEMQGIKHHMIDICNPCDSFSVSEYQNKAVDEIDKLLFLGKTPIICGGTGFYINSVLYDYSYGKSARDSNVRKKYYEMAENLGKEYVYEHLKQIDPFSADKLHFNDIKRVIRALELAECGVKKSQLNDGSQKRYDYFAFCVNYPREQLYQRIHRRVDEMFDKGLVNEVKTLLADGLTAENQSMQAIGYKELLDYLVGNADDLELVKETIKLNTRHYAKRQQTYFKKLEGLIFLEPDDTEKLAKRIVGEFNDR